MKQHQNSDTPTSYTILSAAGNAARLRLVKAPGRACDMTALFQALARLLRGSARPFRSPG